MAADFRNQRAAAAFPFAALCLVCVLTVIVMKVNELNRVPLKTLNELRASQPPAAQQGAQPSQTGPMTGLPLPDLTLPAMDGKPVSLSSFRGKVLFVNLWATWCAPCRDEMPSMQKLYEQMKGENFEMVAISIDKDGLKAVGPFVKDLGLTFPILLDVEQKASPLFKITGVPETFLVSPEGTILHHLVGPADWDRPEIANALKTLARKTFIAGKNQPK